MELNNKKKLEILNTLLNFDHILIFVNPKMPGLKVPEYLLSSESITFKLSRYFKGHLSITENGIEAVLKFKGIYHSCFFPADSIWGAMTPNGQSILWLECAPEGVELSSKMNQTNSSSKPKAEIKHLRRIK